MTTFHPGLPFLPRLLAIESASNLLIGSLLILSPSTLLSAPCCSACLPADTQTMQYFGVCALAFSVPLALGFPDTVSGVAIRRAAYWSNALAEAALVPVLLWQAGKGEVEWGVACGVSAALVGVVGWRVYVLRERGVLGEDVEGGEGVGKKEH
ncbi:Hypothetical protein D9617_1g083090 [Elsinoe fawcettii]|nr:Hypothetical protein D9617_1g083090 [Elsinoe fawcettii]